jgi:hypothetical protein
VILSEYVKRNAGRWLDRKLPPVAAPVSRPTIPVFELDGAEPDHATLRAACTLMRGEQVLVDGRWLTIDRAECLRGWRSPSQTLLHVGGAVLGAQFDYSYWSRDADEQELAAKESAA